MKSILVTGAYGQLGQEFNSFSKKHKDFNFIFTDIDKLDISDKKELELFFSDNSINYVINCAAYTAVDKAESEPELAHSINCDAVVNLISVCNKFNTRLIHFSTDYVFNGRSNTPYSESDKKDPISVYGKTKLISEELIINELKSGIILRTSWLYSSFGNNFVKTMLRLGSEKDQINVVSDQKGTPCYGKDLTYVVMNIINQIECGDYVCVKPEIFNYSGEGICSWYDFAVEIMKLGKINCKVNPISTEDYPTPATRPSYSVLSKTKIKKAFNINIKHWHESLKECINIINN